MSNLGTLSSTTLQFTGPNKNITLLATSTSLILNNRAELVVIGSSQGSINCDNMTIGKGLFITGPIIQSVPNYFIMRSGSNQSINSSSVTEVTTFFNGGQTFSSGTVITNPSPGRLQVSVAGLYMYNSCVVFSAPNNSGFKKIFLSINAEGTDSSGGEIAGNMSATISSSGESGQVIPLNIMGPVYLGSGSFVSTFAFQNSVMSSSLLGSGYRVQTSLYKIN